MPITFPLNNPATGKPVKAYTPVQVNREPARKAVQQASAATYGEFKTVSKQRNIPTVDELGVGAARVSRKGQPGPIVDMIV